MRRLITHGDRAFGIDPLMTETGIAQIQALVMPKEVSLLVYGTGQRFCQVRDLILLKLAPGIKTMPSTFCGSPDGLEADDSIILTNGDRAPQDVYLGLVHAVNLGFFQPWRFLRSLPEDALLCAGSELMLALEAANHQGGRSQGRVFEGKTPEKGRIYELNPDNLTGRLLK